MEDLKLLAKIQALEVCSHQLLALEAVERPLRERWAALTELAPSAELKQLLRAGVPREHRARVWRWLVPGTCTPQAATKSSWPGGGRVNTPLPARLSWTSTGPSPPTSTLPAQPPASRTSSAECSWPFPGKTPP